jgi:hypothetical protein
MESMLRRRRSMPLGIAVRGPPPRDMHSARPGAMSPDRPSHGQQVEWGRVTWEGGGMGRGGPHAAVVTASAAKLWGVTRPAAPRM